MSKIAENDTYIKNVRDFGKKSKALLILLIVGSFGITLTLGSFDIVESGNARIAVEPDGTISGPVFGGWHLFWCSPFAAKYDFVIRGQTVQFEGMHADTLDGHVDMSLSVTYSLPIDNVIPIFEKYGSEYQTYINSVILSTFRSAFASNTMRAVALENRSQIQSICKQEISNELALDNIELLSLKVDNILLPASFSEAQIKTQIAYENLRAAETENAIKLLEANVQAEIDMIEAISKQNVILLEANTTAQALEIVVEHLNVTGNLTEDHVLTYLYLQQLPSLAEYGNIIIITDGSVPFVIDINDE